MEQTSTKRINQSETLQLPGEQRESDTCLAVRDDVCGSDRKQRITRGIIHDVNNHLSIVINYAYVLARYLKQDNQLSGYVKEMRKAAWRASELSQQLSVSSERNTDEPQIQDINFTISELAPLLRSLIGQSVRLELKLAEDLWSVDIPIVRIEQILINLAVGERDRLAGRGTLVVESSNCEIKDNYPDRPSGIILGRYVRLNLASSRDLADTRDADRSVRDIGSQSDLRRQSSVGPTIIADAIKQCNGYMFQMNDDNGGSTYTIYLPTFVSKVDELEETPTSIPSSSSG